MGNLTMRIGGDEDAQNFVDALKKHNMLLGCTVMDFEYCYLYNGQSLTAFRCG